MAIHIIPQNDTHEHIEDSTCKCGPDLFTENGEMIFTHHSWDGREIIEELMQDTEQPDDDSPLEQCPHCGSLWGCEEMDFQECDCCGYPDVDEHEEWDVSEGIEWGDDDDDQDLPSPVCCGSCVNFVSTAGNAGYCKAKNMAGTGRYDICEVYIEAH